MREKNVYDNEYHNDEWVSEVEAHSFRGENKETEADDSPETTINEARSDKHRINGKGDMCLGKSELQAVLRRPVW